MTDRLLTSLLIALVIAVLGGLPYIDYVLDNQPVSMCKDWLCQLAEASNAQ